jgi:hypothetical protein
MQAHGERIKSTTHQAESIPGTHVWIRPLQKLLPPEVLNASPCLSSSRCSKDSMQGVVPDSILRDAAYDGHEFLKPAGNVTILTLSPRLYADSFFMALLSHFLQVQAFTLHPLDFELQKRLTRRLCHTHKHTYTHTHTHPDTYTPRHIHTQTHTHPDTYIHMFVPSIQFTRMQPVRPSLDILADICILSGNKDMSKIDPVGSESHRTWVELGRCLSACIHGFDKL